MWIDLEEVQVRLPEYHGNTFVCFDPTLNELLGPDQKAFNAFATSFTTDILPLPYSEYCLEIGGTILAIKTNSGAKPGIGILDILDAPFKYKFVQQDRGDAPQLIIPTEHSPNYPGPKKDSSLLQPEDFALIAEICHRLMYDDRVDRITIVTGTDTAEYLGAAIARMLSHPLKPIVVIGSMKKVGDEQSDAEYNYHEGRFVASELDPGVFVYLDKDTHDARRVSKEHSTAVDAFQSLGAEHVASFRHDMHPFIQIGLNYIKRQELYDHYCMNQELEAVWDWCQRNRMPHHRYRVNFHMYAPEQKDEVLADYRKTPHPYMPNYAPHNMVRSKEELLRPPQPILDTKFDNLAYYEHVTPGYKPEWLRALLEREDVHGVILDGIAEVDLDVRAELLAIIAEYSDKKPIVSMQDPSGLDSKSVETFHIQAKYLGAIPSCGLTVAYGSFCLKWLLGHNLTVDEIRDSWKHSEYIGGTGYVPIHPEDKRFESDKFLNSFSQVESGIRYVHLIPGFEPAWIRHIYEQSDTEAVVIGAFGTGNFPFEGERDLLSVVMEFADQVPTVVRTQCPNGPTVLSEYEPGAHAERSGILSAGELSLTETICKLDRLLQSKENVAQKW